jgi:nucleotide-binding universal stress UspA family protein
MHRAPCDVMFVQPRDLQDIERIAVIADRGPHDPLEVATADAVARRTGAVVDFVYALSAEATEEQHESLKAYHRGLAEMCSATVESHVRSADDRKDALIEATDACDLVVMGESAHRLLYDVVFGDLPDEVADESATTVMLVNTRKPLRHTFLRWLVERISYA